MFSQNIWVRVNKFPKRFSFNIFNRNDKRKRSGDAITLAAG